MRNHVLLGKTILGIDLADDRQAIRFRFDSEDPVIALCDGDCCSYTWIENVENPEALIGSPVLEAVDIEMPTNTVSSFHHDADVVANYGFKISTARGTCVIDFRNDSNGYYGGSLTWPRPADADPHDYYPTYYGGVFGQNRSEQKWKRLV